MVKCNIQVPLMSDWSIYTERSRIMQCQQLANQDWRLMLWQLEVQLKGRKVCCSLLSLPISPLWSEMKKYPFSGLRQACRAGLPLALAEAGFWKFRADLGIILGSEQVKIRELLISSYRFLFFLNCSFCYCWLEVKTMIPVATGKTAYCIL